MTLTYAVLVEDGAFGKRSLEVRFVVTDTATGAVTSHVICTVQQLGAAYEAIQFSAEGKEWSLPVPSESFFREPENNRYNDGLLYVTAA